MRYAERSIAPLMFLLMAIAAIAITIYKPAFNWDMIAYIGSAKAYEENDIKTLHAFTYSQYRQVDLPTKERTLNRVDTYRLMVDSDPSAFEEQLPFYQFRLLYTGLIYLLYKAGMNIAFATHFISGVAVALAMALLYRLSVKHLAQPFVYAVPALALIFGALNVAQLTSPDGLAFLSIVITSSLYLNRRLGLLLIWAPLSLGIRTDLMLFTIPLLFFVLSWEKSYRGRAILSVVASLVVYFGLGMYWGNPGWKVTFYHTFVEHLAFPLSKPPRLLVEHYFSTLVSATTRAIILDKSVVLYGVLTCYGFFLIQLRSQATSLVSVIKTPGSVLLMVCLIFMLTHFLAFPVHWERFYVGAYLFGGFAMLMLLTDYLSDSSGVKSVTGPACEKAESK